MSVAQTIARAVAAPAGAPYQRPLQLVCLLLAVGVLVGIATLSLPPVSDVIVAGSRLSWLKSHLCENRPFLARWSSSLRIWLETLTAITVGGSVFAASVAESVRNRLGEYGVTRDQKANAEIARLQQDIETTLVEIERLLDNTTWRNLLKRITQLVSLSSRVYRLALSSVPSTYRRFATVALYTSFPGGLYGLAAFALLTALFYVKLVQLYLPLLVGNHCP